MRPFEPPSREGPKTFPEAENISVSDVVALGHNKGSQGPDEEPRDNGTPAPFQSRFSRWIRTVALIVVLIFLPEQVSWAFNYNPLTLWGQDDRQMVMVSPDATADEIVSACTPENDGAKNNTANNNARRSSMVLPERQVSRGRKRRHSSKYGPAPRTPCRRRAWADPSPHATSQSSETLCWDSWFRRSHPATFGGHIRDRCIEE